MRYETIVVGASAGGIEALRIVLSSLPADFSMAVVIVLHIQSTIDGFLIDYLNSICEIPVKEADEKEKIMHGVVYIAPPNYHLLIEEDRTFSLSIDEHVNYARPSIDVLFETAAEVYNERLIGIVLTGGNRDGAFGLKRIEESGGFAVIQDPETAIADSMPQSAIAQCKTPRIVRIEEIGPLLIALSGSFSDYTCKALR
ncbi:MAG: chemotaxis protein CheB [Thermodesulfobacteriota bacterium]|nr:chemotaxis protein CheB [Thermodesulfobacteriota bacterium]